MTQARNRMPHWCPVHERGLIRRGRHRCLVGKKRGVNCITTSSPAALTISARRIEASRLGLVPMRRKGQETLRAIERRIKGYAR